MRTRFDAHTVLESPSKTCADTGGDGTNVAFTCTGGVGELSRAIAGDPACFAECETAECCGMLINRVDQVNYVILHFV